MVNNSYQPNFFFSMKVISYGDRVIVCTFPNYDAIVSMWFLLDKLPINVFNGSGTLSRCSCSPCVNSGWMWITSQQITMRYAYAYIACNNIHILYSYECGNEWFCVTTIKTDKSQFDQNLRDLWKICMKKNGKS